jgi:lipid II:glycine glycyltransferase (peptidoglycan interpeptide bridge formation enzyme)
LKSEAAGSAEFILNITGCDLSVCEKADSFLQSALWGTFKSRFGWTSRAFLVNWSNAFGDAAAGGAAEQPLLILSRRLVPGFSFAYAPWAPELPAAFPAQDRTHALAELARKLRSFLPRNTAFIRFDPPWFREEAAGESPPAVPPLGVPFRRAAADIQPPDTVLVDLAPSTQDILAAMKPKWRYNIGLAEKRGVSVSRPDEQGLEVFYKLLSETAGRDGIAIHHFDYYKTLFEISRDSSLNGDLRLYTAEHEGDALAAIVVLCRGTQAVYLYGASANLKRNLMAPYALQWKAMQDAKASGCVLYDLFGIPPADDPNHPMAGLYRFKTGFGGRIIHRPGSWDYAYKPLLCGLFSTAERCRKRRRDSRKKNRSICEKRFNFLF